MDTETNGRGRGTLSWFGKAAVPFIKMKEKTALICKTVFRGASEISPEERSEDRMPLEAGETEQWKTQALEDFKAWLSEVPDKAPPALSVTPDTCDLYTLLSEFTALRQEIKMQNREQHRTLKAMTEIKAMTDAYEEVMGHFNEKTKGIASLEQNIRRSTEKRTVLYFLDIRDSLVRGRAACLATVPRKGFFRRTLKNMENIHDGYDMAIRKFDASLALLDIYPMETTGAAFDPMTMKALESRLTEGMEKGTVVETISGGFRRGNEILRYAQVIVAG